MTGALNTDREAATAAAPDGPCVSILRIHGPRANKLVKLNGSGEIEKSGAVQGGSYAASTVPAPDAEALAGLLDMIGRDPTMVLCLGVVDGIERGRTFDVLPRRKLAARLDLDPGDDGVIGVHEIGKRPAVARLKANMRPGGWALIDRDMVDDMPEALADLGADDWLAAMDTLLPGLAQADRVLVPSTSGRILRNGSPISTKPSWHLFVRVDDPEDFRDRIWPQLLVKAFATKLGEAVPWSPSADIPLGFNRPKYARDGSGVVVAQQPWSIFDPSTIGPERLVYDGQPVVEGDGLSIADPVVETFPGPPLRCSAFQDVPDTALERLERDHKIRVQRTKGNGAGRASAFIVTSATLDLDLEVDTETGARTIREIADAGEHVRCQSPFRESTSWAAYVNVHQDGTPFLFDAGTNTKYVLGAEALAKATEANDNSVPLLLDPANPLPTARAFVTRHYMHDGARTLHYHRGMFYAWTGTHYAEKVPADLRSQMYKMLERAKRPVGEGKTAPFKPTTTKVNDAIDALKAVTVLSDRADAPMWLEGSTYPPPDEIMPCRNGLLHLQKRSLYPPSPLFFCTSSVAFDYYPDAPEPDGWHDFMDSVWRDDPEAIDTLQEVFGYLLTQDTRHQKAFLLVGPRRSGKGTIARVLKELLGRENVAGPILSALGQNFGLQPLIGKPLAIIPDARLSGRADQHLIAERLLSITGEDVLTIDRKYRESWTGTLPSRLMILTNELPRIADSSGALASRFIGLVMTRSFLGCEDHGLTDRLLRELPGILNWAIEGWERLRARGRFVQPASAAEAIQDLEDLASPVAKFVREKCETGPGKEVRCDTLYIAWRHWCEQIGRDHPGNQQTFGRDLHAAVPGLKTVRRRVDDEARARFYEGIGLA